MVDNSQDRFGTKAHEALEAYGNPPCPPVPDAVRKPRLEVPDYEYSRLDRMDGLGMQSVPVDRVGPNWYDNSDPAPRAKPAYYPPMRPHIDLTKRHGLRPSVRVGLLAIGLFLVVFAASFLAITKAKADPSIAGQDLTGGEESFLVDVDYFASQPEELPSDKMVLSIGYTVCAQLDNGDGVQAAMDAALADLGNDMDAAYNSGIVTSRAVLFLCPRNAQIVDDFLDTDGSFVA